MKAAEAVIAWTPSHNAFGGRGQHTRGQVKVCSRPPYSSVDPYAFWVYAGVDGSDLDDVAMVFIHFNTIVVRDKVDPQVAHEAFLQIDEYRQRISPDIAGAEP
ncbi:MAG: hypothetical protein JNK30_21130 [Phenylobacterium sp.]|uniref:hypothetical protein n=1 Tax=Phenylobacterium sp. TaxID=1871053 RepID=UPI001A4E1577|nr:hypothetical protein [Phenylobacterium sp.]MBL8773904.1 hypothetical protein [Phenylobacterium sp.]